ncbi:retrovirus-related pol polyprotein from transposon TNT 1-94 [Tanacetum coccineum]|uniref:Retrovirus-related pol polyprotein from transposon TNT 1-94 n=1 Tax=Tanacetum coccineum TaxID=301880 RepID=A0ABQ5EJ96_9ASTR
MTAGQRKPETQWAPEERKAANLDQRLKSLIMSVLLDDQMNSVINCLTEKSTWDDLILYHKGPSDVKESRVIDLKLCYNTFKFKEDESLTQTFTRYKALMNELVHDGIKLLKLEINTGFINGLPKKWLAFCQSLRNTNHVKEFELASLFDSLDDEEDTRSSQEYMYDLEEEYQARALLAKSKRFFKKGTKRLSSTKATNQTECHKCGKNGHFARDFKALMAFANEERVSVGKESARNDEWIKISMKKVHTLLEMEDNNDRKSFLDYLCIDLNYVDEQRNNLMPKHRNLVQELNTCKEHILVLKQAKLDLLTMQHVNTKILKENQNLRNELKELTSIIEAWLNSSNKVNQCINNSEVSITSSNKPKLSESEDSTMSNHDTGKHPLPPLKKLTGAEPVFGPKTIKSILKSKSTFKAKTLKGIIINEPSSAPARGNKSSSTSKTNSAPARPEGMYGNNSTYTTEGYGYGMIDNTLFIYKTQTNVILVQIHVDDIILGSTSTKIEQSERGISINKERYVKDLLRKYDKIGSSMNTLIVPPNILGPDLNGKAVNESQYKGFDLKGYSESDCTGCNMDRKSTSADAEDVAATGCCANILWIKSQLTVYDIIYEKIKNHTLKRDIEFYFIPTQYQLADIFIKPLDKPSFKRLIDELGMLNIDSKPEALVLLLK